MDGFEFNKIAGAVLGTALGVMALGIIGEIIYAPAESEKPGYEIAVAGQPATNGTGTEGKTEVPPIAIRLQTADAAAGKTVATKCKACHTLEKGAPKQTGPNLYGVVGGPLAHMEGFPYSDALLKKKAEVPTWTFENLDTFLTSPKAFIPKTAMTFPGLPKPEDRANVIAYLNSLSDSPLPMPEASAAPAAPAAPATTEPATAPAN